MERPDLEQLMHNSESFAFDVLAHANGAKSCAWVIFTRIMDEDIAKMVRDKPDRVGPSYLFHYHWPEIQSAAQEYQRYYKPHRKRLH